MSAITYLSPNCFKCSSIQALVIKPYGESINNFKLALNSKIYASDSSNTSKKFYLSLSQRIKHFVFGVLLIVPFINSYVMSLLKIADKKTTTKVIKLQSIFRGRQGRRVAKQKRKELAAAIKLQSLYRGKQARRFATRKMVAILTFQNAYRQLKVRRLLKKTESQKMELMVAKFAEVQTLAATKIQATFRGWRVRQAFKPNSKIVLVTKPSDPVKISRIRALGQKILKFCLTKKGMDLTSKVSGLDMNQAWSSVGCLASSLSAFRKGKFKMGTILAFQSFGHAMNAAVHLVVPHKYFQMDKLTNPAKFL